MEKPLGLLVALFLVAFTFTTVGRLHISSEVRIWVEIARVRIRPLKKKLIRPEKKRDGSDRYEHRIQIRNRRNIFFLRNL